MTLGTLIGLLSIAAFLLTTWAMFSRRQADIEIIERRIRDIAKTAPDHPGVVLPFRRRA